MNYFYVCNCISGSNLRYGTDNCFGFENIKDKNSEMVY